MNRKTVVSLWVFLFTGWLAGMTMLARGLWRLGAWTARTLRTGVVIGRNIGREIRCPRGCRPQAADGWWVCGRCMARYHGWVWGACPACDAQMLFVPCETCGHAIRNPLADRKKDSA